MTTLTLLTAIDACDPALQWVRDQPDQEPAALWATCPRGDWLAWYLGRLAARAGQGSPEHRRATLVSVLCARTATPHAGQWREEIEALLAQIEEWAHGVARVDLGALRGRLWAVRISATNTAYYAALAAAHAAYAVADAAARRAHLADLADLIRAAVPTPPPPGGE